MNDGVTLEKLLNLLNKNLNLTLTIIDNDEQIITFNAAGSGAIDVILGIRIVERIGVEAADHFNIYLEAVPGEP